MPFHESFDEFKVRMESDCEFIRSRYLFRNAAQSNGDNVHIEPPTDPVELAKLKKEFLQFRLEHAIKEFNAMKTYVEEQAAMRLRYRNAVPPSSDSVEILKRIQGRIFRLRASIEAIADDPESESLEEKRRRISDELEQKERQRIQQIKMDAAQISI